MLLRLKFIRSTSSFNSDIMHKFKMLVVVVAVPKRMDGCCCWSHLLIFFASVMIRYFCLKSVFLSSFFLFLLSSRMNPQMIQYQLEVVMTTSEFSQKVRKPVDLRPHISRIGQLSRWTTHWTSSHLNHLSAFLRSFLSY